MTFLNRIKAILHSVFNEPVKSRYIVIPKAVLSDLMGRARLMYPGKRFQVILREYNGKFQKHPGKPDSEPEQLF